MKTRLLIIIAVSAFAISFVGCKAQYGCPSSGRNVGAERLLSGDKKSMKAVKHAGKFQGSKIPN